jgi:hypothetical protein
MEFQVNVWATAKILTTSFEIVKLRIEIMYTAAENAEMLIIYGECRCNTREDGREYAIRFPHPNYNVFLRLVYRARDIGSLVPS